MTSHHSRIEPEGPEKIAVASEGWKKILRDGSAEMGLAIGRAESDCLGLHAAELMKFNQKMNLTAIREPVKVAANHYLDSLAALPFLPSEGRLLDIGSGGGFPGIPLKVLRPGLRLVLIDSSRKKVSFLKHAIRTLKLEGAQAVQARAQELSEQDGFARSFDIVVSRALCKLEDFFSMGRPFLNAGGRMLGWKGGDVADELKGLQDRLQDPDIARFSIQVHSYLLPLTHGKRSLVILSARDIPRREGGGGEGSGPGEISGVGPEP